MRIAPFTIFIMCSSALLFNSGFAAAQSVTALIPAPTSQIAPSTSSVSNALLAGTPVKLRLAETVSSATAKAGQQVPFEVVDEVQVGGVTVIAKGATALATVTDAEHKKTMGRGGKLDLNVDSVRLIDNEKAQLRATAGGKGGGHTGAMTGAIVATSVLFFPAAPLFLFMHGKDITLPKGLETTAFIDGDMKLNLLAFHASGMEAAAPASISQVAVDANVPNCDISVDSAFAGNTPSSLALPGGTHVITVHKQGYADWTRTLAASGNSIRVQAEMQPKTASK